MTSTQRPTGPDRDPEAVAARRRVAREHHPDIGGDPAVFVREMARVDRQFGPPPPARRMHSDPSRARYAARRALGRLGGRLRTALPRHVPGSRRYVEL